MKRANVINNKKEIKSIGGFYSTTDLLDARRNFFFVDKINLLKTHGKFVQVLDLTYGDTSFINEILNKTTVKSIKVYRVPSSNNRSTYYEEQVLVGEFGIGSQILGFEYSTKSTGVSANSDAVVISTLNVTSDVSINNIGLDMFNLNDFLSRNSLKDNFRYKIEVEYHDGLKTFYDRKVYSYKKKIANFKKLINSLNNKKYFYNLKSNSNKTNQGFDINIINQQSPIIFGGKVSTNTNESNVELIDRQIRTAIGYYLELKTIINPRNSRIAKQIFDNYYKTLNFRSTSIGELNKFFIELERVYSNFESQTTMYYQSADSINSTKSFRKNKTDKSLKTIFYSSNIENQSNYGKLSFIRPTLDLKSIPSVKKGDLSNRLSANGGVSNSKDMKIGTKIFDSLNGTRIKKALVESFLKNFMGSDNTVKVSKFETKTDSQSSLNQEQMRDRTSLLLALNSIGISFPSSVGGKTKNLVKETTSETVDSKKYFSNSDNTFNSVDTATQTTSKQIDLQFSEIVSSVEDLVGLEDVVIGYSLENSGLESKKIRSDSYGHYLDKIFLGSRIEYLQGFEMFTIKEKVSNTFSPVWVALDSESLKSVKKGTYLMCRVMNDLNPKTKLNVEKALNFVTINKFFILEGN